jgi:D-hydroxyproline dehydrogenase subunit gamma
MFKRLEENAASEVTITFDGKDLPAHEGENLAAALLSAGLRSTRATAVSGEERAPFCMMGTCYDCIVEIDGETVQACMTTVEDGLQIQRVARVGDD